MNSKQVGNVLTVGVLLLGGYYIWQKFGASLLSSLSSAGSALTVSANPYAGSLTAANQGVAYVERGGDPTLNKDMTNILNFPVSTPVLTNVLPAGTFVLANPTATAS